MKITEYTISSTKGVEQVFGYRAAVQAARKMNRDLQPAFGVSVSRPDGRVVFEVGR